MLAVEKMEMFSKAFELARIAACIAIGQSSGARPPPAAHTHALPGHLHVKSKIIYLNKYLHT